MSQLDFERIKEALSHSVIVAVTFSTHAGSDAVAGQCAAKFGAGILDYPVRVVNARSLGFPRRKTAISKARQASSALSDVLVAQPTTLRANKSIITVI